VVQIVQKDKCQDFSDAKTGKKLAKDNKKRGLQYQSGMVGPHSGKDEATNSLNKEEGAIQNNKVPHCPHCKRATENQHLFLEHCFGINNPMGFNAASD
jgi:hypothetical protein